MHAWTKVAGMGPVQTASAQTKTLCVFQTKLKHSFGLLHNLNVHWQRQQNHQIPLWTKQKNAQGIFSHVVFFH